MRSDSVEIYIMLRDRIEYLDEAVESVIAACDKNTSIIFSDNSEFSNVGKYVLSKWPNIKYIRRNSLHVLDHHNVILSECESDYLVMFHDDDVMMSNYVTEMRKLIAEGDFVAIGSNAMMIDCKSQFIRPFIRNIRHSIVLKEPCQLASRYLSLIGDDPAPFPSYIYNKKKLKNLIFDVSRGGRLNDSIFLCNLLSQGQIAIHSSCLMNYRVHKGNGYSTVPFRERLSWYANMLSFIKENDYIAFYGHKLFYYSNLLYTRPNERPNKLLKATSLLAYKFLCSRGVIDFCLTYILFKLKA